MRYLPTRRGDIGEKVNPDNGIVKMPADDLEDVLPPGDTPRGRDQWTVSTWSMRQTVDGR